MRQIIKKWSCFEVLSPDLTWKEPGLEGPSGLLPPPALACSPMLIFAYPTLATTCSARVSPSPLRDLPSPWGSRGRTVCSNGHFPRRGKLGMRTLASVDLWAGRAGPLPLLQRWGGLHSLLRSGPICSDWPFIRGGIYAVSLCRDLGFA